MDFDEIINAHVNWKLQLHKYLANPDDSLNIDELSSDDACIFGFWLSGQGKEYQTNPHYEQIVEEHRLFHIAAADLVRRKINGDDIWAEIIVGSPAPFSRHSENLILLMYKLKTSIES
jgi:hypothetical protein